MVKRGVGPAGEGVLLYKKVNKADVISILLFSQDRIWRKILLWGTKGARVYT